MKKDKIYFFLTLLTLIYTAIPSPAGQQKDDTEEQPIIEFKVNGEAVTRDFIQEGLDEANFCAPEVCPTDSISAWKMRQSRLIRLIPIRQFLEKENIIITKQTIEKQIEIMKAHPDPFKRYPPKPLSHVMVRECISWSDLRLMIRTDTGMQRWAEREWRRKWPTERKWKNYCKTKNQDFNSRFGKFRRMSFTFMQWPKGANNETEALKLLKVQADAAKKSMDAGQDFINVAQKCFPYLEKRNNNAITAITLPFDFLGLNHAETLRNLKIGQCSKPLKTRMSWELVKREPATNIDIGIILKKEFIYHIRKETEQMISAKTNLIRINLGDTRKTILD